MKNKHNMYVLASIMMLLSISWGVSHWQNKKQYLATHVDIAGATIVSNFDGLSEKQVYDLIGPSLYSGNISLMAKTLSQFQSWQAYSLLEYITTQEEKIISDQEFILLVCAMVKQYESKKDREQLLSLFSKYTSLFEKIPLLYTIAASNYKSLIIDIDSWIQDHADDPVNHFYDAYAYAIEHNDVEVFQTLLTQRITVEKSEANKLLVKVIEQEADAQFVTLLVNELGADVNYSPDGEKTVLMLAVEQNNPSLVRVLLKAGADMDMLLDVEIGTALQIAIVESKTEAELVLREFGAQE